MSIVLTQRSLLPVRRDGQVATVVTTLGGSGGGGGGGGGGSMVYPGAGIPISNTTSWGTSITPSNGLLRYTTGTWSWDNSTYLTAVTLNDVGNPTGNKLFTMTTNQLKFLWTNPTPSDGSLELEITGNYSGDVLHIHQNTGTPGAGTDLLHLEATHTNVTPLRINGPSTGLVMVLRNPAGTLNYNIYTGAITSADRNLTLPAITGSDTLASLGLGQTFTGANTFSGTNTFYSGQRINNPGNTAYYTLTSAAIGGNRVLNLPAITGTDTLVVLNLAQTFTTTQTFRAATAAARFENASAQDAIAIAGRAAGVNNYAITILPATLSANVNYTLPASASFAWISSYHHTITGPAAARTYTFPDSNQTIAGLGVTGQIFTTQQSFSHTDGIKTNKIYEYTASNGIWMMNTTFIDTGLLTSSVTSATNSISWLLNTDNTISGTGSLLVSVQNMGSEKASISKSGTITAVEDIIAYASGGTGTPLTADTFKTWYNTTDPGGTYTWVGTGNSVVASGNDTMDIIGGTGISISVDTTLKAIRITNSGTVSQWTNDTYGIHYSSGNVGIGADSLSGVKLNVFGYVRFGAIDGSYPWELQTSSGADEMYIKSITDNAIRLTINTDGNVGIGTTTPVSIVEISSTTPYLSFSKASNQVDSGDAIGVVNFYSRDASTTSTGGVGSIQVRAEADYNTATTPSYMAFYTHPNSANNASVLGAATEKMRITAAGYVGIGTSAPTKSLVIRKDVASGVGASLFLRNDQYTYGAGAETEIVMGIYTYNELPYRYGKIHTVGLNANGQVDRISIGIGDSDVSYSDYFTVKAGGNIGIGTTAPAALLSLGNGVTAQKLLLYDNANNVKYGFGIQTNELRTFFPSDAGFASFGTIAIGDGTTWSEKMRITKDGNVGIGNTYAVSKVQIQAADTDRVIIGNSTNDVNQSSPKLSFWGGGGNSSSTIIGPSIQKVQQTSYGRGDLVFYQHGGADYTSETEVMRIGYTGKVGINVSATPTRTLEIECTSTTGVGLYVNRNLAAASTDSAVVYFRNQNSSDDQPTLYVDHVGYATAVRVAGNNVNACGQYISNTSGTSGISMVAMGATAYGYADWVSSGFLEGDVNLVMCANTGILRLQTARTTRVTVANDGKILLGDQTIAALARVQTCSADQASTPALNYAVGVGLAVSSGANTNYGIAMGTASSGNSWIQVKRFDATATSYHLLLQPSGGYVSVGTTALNNSLTVYNAIWITNNTQTCYIQENGTEMIIHNGYGPMTIECDGDIVFKTYNGSYLTRMTIQDNTGYVGVGMSPSYIFDTNGVTRLNSYFFAHNSAWAIDGSATAGQSGFFVRHDSASYSLTPLGLGIAISRVSTTALYVTNTGGGNCAVFDGGNTGFGATSPNAKIDVQGSSSTAVFAMFGNNSTVGATYPAYIYMSAANTINSAYNIASDGAGMWLNYYGYQNSTSYYRDLVIGNGKGATLARFYGSTNAFICVGETTAFYSDMRLKTNIEPIKNAIDKVKRLNGFTYYSNGLAGVLMGSTEVRRKVGMSAQDMQEVLPEAVRLAPFDMNPDGSSKSGLNYLTIQYEKTTPLIIEAIKEEDAKVEALTKRVDFLERELARYKN